MATVRRPRRHTLADKLDLDDVDKSLDILDDLTEPEYDEYVELYLHGDRRGMGVMRHPDNVERLYDTLTKLRDVYRRRHDDAMVRAIEVERRAVGAEARKERDLRRQEQAAEREVEVLGGVSARLERARRKVEEQQAAIRAAQAKSLTTRAHEILASRHPREFVAIKRELKEQDARDAEQAHVNGAGAADPPAGGSTAPRVPVQSAR